MIYILLFLFLFTTPGYAAIIFQDNFDNCTVGCTVNTSNAPNSANWVQWFRSEPLSSTQGGVTHYAGEITSPGRGGSGNSLKLWRYGSFTHDYNGSLVATSPGSYSDFYMRFYVKIPTDMNMTGGTYLKMFRFNTSGGEIYININPGGGDLKSTGSLQVHAGSWITILNNAQLSTLWDGEWHAWQFRFNLATSTLTFWVDGVETVNLTSVGFSGVWNYLLQHFPLGNADGTWQSSWQAFEVDDLIIATTKAETDPDGGGGEDDTAPDEFTFTDVSNASLSTQYTSNTITVAGIDASTTVIITGGTYSKNGAAYTSDAGTAVVGDTFTVRHTSSAYYSTATNTVLTIGGISDTYTTTTIANPSGANLLLTQTFDTAIPDNWGIWNPNIFVSSPAQNGNSVQWAWAALAEQPTGVNSAHRWAFTETDTLYALFYWRFDSSWRGTGWGYHPHIIYILPAIGTNLAGGDLRVYVETTDSGTNYAIPRIVVGRGASTDFYTATSTYNMAANTWHKIEVYLVNNTVGSANGVARMTINGVEALNVTNATFRTSAGVRFGAIAIGPWMSASGQGPNVSQTMWMDELTIYDGIPSTPTLTIPAGVVIGGGGDGGGVWSTMQ